MMLTLTQQFGDESSNTGRRYYRLVEDRIKMFRAFQVNEGRFLPLENELSPTARVSELCSAVRAVGREAEEDQVMLTSDGKQMDPADMIGAYSVGMESKPIFVFYRSYLTSPHPPTTLSRLPRRGELDLQLELLHHKPTPSLFQKLVVLSKRLSEYAVSVGGLCGQLSEEYQLQYNGWCTALANCDAIVRTYQKHHQLFTKEVDTFRSTKPEFIQLLKEFPERVELLRQLPMPSTLQEQNPASSLYDWINTHDDRNTLLDLSRECKKAMSNLDNVSIDAALNATHQIAEETTKLHSQDDQFQERVKELAAVAAKATELRDTVVALAQNIQSTSDRARRYGDAGTIADLVMSHHRSLQMMSDSCKQLDSLAKGAEQSKVALTGFIHAKLQQVAKLQERVAHSNGQLLLIHEHIKLARKRFEILRQVCHTPQVLAHVLSEVDRRMAFSSALEKRAEEVGRCLRQAREEEKQLRRAFVSKYGQHFIATLFPELAERVPDVSVHLPRSLSKSSQSYHTDLERMRQLLPPEMRPSPASASMQLLSSPLLTSLPLGSSHGLENTGTSSNDIDSQAGGMSETKHRMKESSMQTVATSLGQSEGTKKLEDRLKMMEASNGELSNSLTACTSELERLKQQLEEKDLTTVKTVTSLEESRSRLQAELSQLVKDNRELCDKIRDKERFIIELESTNKRLLERCGHAEEQIKHLEPINEEITQRVQQLEEEMNQLRLKNDLLTSEKALVDVKLKQKAQELESLELRQREFSGKQDNELKQHQLAVLNLESRISELLLLNESSKAENLQLKLSLSQLESANEECRVQMEALKAEATSNKTLWEREKVSLEEQVRRLSSELKECQSLKDVLTDEVNKFTSTSSTLTLKEEEISQLRHEVQEAKESHKQITKERDSLMAEIHELKQQCRELKEEQSRQALRHQRAQSTISNLKSQMAVAESKAKEYRSKLEAAENEVDSLQNKSRVDIDDMKLKLHAAEEKITDLESQVNAKEAYISTLLESQKAAKDEASRTNNELEEKVRVLELKLKEEVDKMKSSADSLTEELEREKKSIKQELSEKVTELESITFERDSYHKQAMEHERELKELQRSLDRESPQTSLSGSPVKSQHPPEPKAAANTGSFRHFYVSIASLREGDVALFVNDSYGNYLALVSDTKIYYLNQGSVPRLKDLGEMVPQLGLKRKILVGRVTGRMHVEVRKEGNRLKVPVGTRMYKLDAETVFP